MDYNDLKTVETCKNVPLEFKKGFEKALDEALHHYMANSYNVDKFEDDAIKCVFSKGFLAGCIFEECRQNEVKIIRNNVERLTKSIDEQIVADMVKNNQFTELPPNDEYYDKAWKQYVDFLTDALDKHDLNNDNKE